VVSGALESHAIGNLVILLAKNTLLLTLLGISLRPETIQGWGIPWDQIRPEFIPLLIFLLRSLNNALGTFRMLLVLRGRAFSGWAIGFVESLTFILGITGVISDLQNPLNLLAYAAGFATGDILGMTLESKVAPGHSFLRIISSRRGNLITEKLRKSGRGVTEIPAKGIESMVSVLFCYVPRREVNKTRDQIIAVDPEVFITVENVRELQGGWRA
jgi:uncharacterized protein YebE (UPF0316 family)